jgi:ABC-2 type transport system permease protein
MRGLWTITKKDLALRVRDRSVFIIGLIAPLALSAIFNLVFGGGINDVGQNISLKLGVVNLDQGSVGEAFGNVLDGFSDAGRVDLVAYSTEDEARTATTDGEVGATFVVPSDLTAAFQAGDSPDIEVIGNVDNPTTTQIADAIATGFAQGVRTSTIAAVTAVMSSAITPDQIAAAAAEAASAAAPVRLGVIEAAARQLDSATYFVAGLSIFFIFFIAGMSVTSMLEERSEGTLNRLLAAPISRGALVGAKALGSVIIAGVSMTVLVLASAAMMNASWGAPLGVVLLVGAAVLAVVAIMTTVGGLARTAEQAGNLQSIVAVTMAMLGGTFVPISQGEGFLSKLTYLTPNAWFMRGLGELAGGGVRATLPAVGVLLGIAVVFGVLGWVGMRKAVTL